MKAAFRENLGEAIVGLLVVLIAGLFISYAWSTTGGGRKVGGVTITAMFPNASGVNQGTDVKVAGVRVGRVVDQSLDPQTYQVAVKIALDPKVKLPNDSSAAVTSEGLLGSPFVSMTPGGSPIPLKEGDTITDTQGAMDLMALIGQFINKPSSASAAGTPAPAGADKAP